MSEDDLSLRQAGNVLQQAVGQLSGGQLLMSEVAVHFVDGHIVELRRVEEKCSQMANQARF